MTANTLLQVSDLKKYFTFGSRFPFGKSKTLKAVDGISFGIYKKEIFALVGESGCGKTTTAKCIVRLLEPDNGTIQFDGVDLLNLTKRELRKIRPRIQMVFQNPYASLNPRKMVYHSIYQPLSTHKIVPKKNLRDKVIELLKKVNLTPPEQYINLYPHELSGGQRQRVGIAKAFASGPDLVIADEPVSSLDISIRGQILNVVKKLRSSLGTSFLYITHDWSVVKAICDRVGVMYLGKIVEIGKTEEVFKNPLHPYTRALLSAVPVPDPKLTRAKKRIILKGDVPSPIDPPAGCKFHTRCNLAENKCSEVIPNLIEVSDKHYVACLKI